MQVVLANRNEMGRSCVDMRMPQTTEERASWSVKRGMQETSQVRVLELARKLEVRFHENTDAKDRSSTFQHNLGMQLLSV